MTKASWLIGRNFGSILAISVGHIGRPLKHEDVTVVSTKSGGSFKGDDIKQEIEKCNFHFFGCMYAVCRIDKMSKQLFLLVLLPENRLFARKSKFGSKFANSDLLIGLISCSYSETLLFLEWVFRWKIGEKQGEIAKYAGCLFKVCPHTFQSKPTYFENKLPCKPIFVCPERV